MLSDLKKTRVLSQCLRRETKESIKKKMREPDMKEWLVGMNKK